jgi:hypothetical protein
MRGNLLKQTPGGVDRGSETGVMFGMGDKTTDDHTWMPSALAISRRLSWYYDDVYRKEIDKQMQNIGGKT